MFARARVCVCPWNDERFGGRGKKTLMLIVNNVHILASSLSVLRGRCPPSLTHLPPVSYATLSLSLFKKKSSVRKMISMNFAIG